MPTWRSFLPPWRWRGLGFGDWGCGSVYGCMAEGGAAALKPKFECIDNDDGGGRRENGFRGVMALYEATHSPELDAAPGTGTDGTKGDGEEYRGDRRIVLE